MEKRNGIISVWKFLFAIVIAFFHCNVFFEPKRNIFFYGGYIAVEFFFIVSGFFFAKSVLKKDDYQKENIGKDTINFILKKIKELLPYVTIAYIVFIPVLFLNHYKITNIINSIWNFLLLREFGFRSPVIMNQLWYLTSMLFSMFLLYPLLKKHRYNFILLASPIIITLGLGYLNHNWLGLDHSYNHWGKYMYTGLLRGFVEINIGMILYYINKKLKNVEYHKWFRFLLTIIGEGLLLLVLAIISFIKVPKHYDYVMLLFIIIAILIILSEKTYEYKVLSVKFFYYLEKLSLPIFINHSSIFNVMKYINVKKLHLIPKDISVLSVIITIIFSIIEMYILGKIKKLQLTKKLKNIIVKDSTPSNPSIENNVII